MLAGRITFSTASAENFEELALLRIAAMRASLESLGRFDAERARERLRNSFYPEATWFILFDGEKVGFYTYRLVEDYFRLEHLYILPAQQSRGMGSWVMEKLIAMADDKTRPIRLGALRDSASNRFYRRHGFVPEREDTWDIYYVRQLTPGSAQPGAIPRSAAP